MSTCIHTYGLGTGGGPALPALPLPAHERLRPQLLLLLLLSLLLYYYEYNLTHYYYY